MSWLRLVRVGTLHRGAQPHIHMNLTARVLLFAFVPALLVGGCTQRNAENGAVRGAPVAVDPPPITASSLGDPIEDSSVRDAAAPDDAAAPAAAASSDYPQQAQADASTDAGEMIDAAAAPAAADDARSDAELAIDASPAPVECRLRAGGPYVLQEGETIELTASCESGLLYPELWVDALPAGAEYDPISSKLSWTPALDQAGVHHLTVHERRSAETASLTIHVIDRWDAPENVPVIDPSQYLEEYGLPVIHLTTDPGLNDDEYTPATIVYRGHSYEGAEAKLRGATSANYPKRSFTLKFSKADKFDEPGFAGGFREKRKLTLITSFDDNSYLRQRLGYELWNRIDRGHIQIQSYNAVLFLNGVYYGLYTVADHVDGYLMEDFGHFQDGDLYKARTPDANFRSNINGTEKPKATLHDGFTKEEGFPQAGEPGAFDRLDAFVSWAIDATPEALVSESESRIARREYEDWWIFVSFIGADDSSSKNSYHYNDPTLPGSLWHVVPWDLNYSFGQDWSTRRVIPTLTKPEGYYVLQNNLFEKLLASPLGPALRERYGTTLTDAYAVGSVLELFDSFVSEIDPSAKRDEQKWRARYRGYPSWSARQDFTSYAEEVEYVRQWIRDRHTYLETLY